MRQPERGSSLYQLSISRAPQLRCVNSLVKSCGICEDCCLGVKLNHTKEWFCRCGEPIKRKYLLGLVQRFDSLDLAEYMTSMLQSLQYKDFTYMRSRSKPSLTMDTSSPPTNHALNETELLDTMENYLKWFSASTYWTKANYMLCLMQLCDSHLLHVVATKTRVLCEIERRKQRALEDGQIIKGLWSFSLLITMTFTTLQKSQVVIIIIIILILTMLFIFILPSLIEEINSQNIIFVPFFL